MTLRARLVLLVMVGIVPLLGLSMLKAWQNEDAAIGRATDNLNVAASLLAANQERVAASAHQILLSIANAPGLVEGKTTDCQRYLKTLKDQLPEYGNLGIIGLDGYLFCHSEVKRPLDFFGDRTYFQAALARRGFVTGGYYAGRATGKPSVPFAMPVMNSDGKVTAVAFAAIDLNEMSKALADAPLPPDGRLVIMDRQGIVLAASPQNPAMVGQQVPSPFLQDAVKAMRTGVGEGLDGEGRQRILAFLPTGKSAVSPFFLAVSVDKAGVIAPARTELGLEFMLLALLGFLGGWLAWVMGTRAIVKPTTELLEATRQAEQGRLDVRIPIRTGDDEGEFSKIAAGFNRMAESLQTQRDALGAELAHSQAVQEKLQDAQRLGRIGYWQSDLDARTVWWSDEVYDVLGVDRALLGNTFEAFLQRVHPDDREAYAAGRDGKFRSGIPRDIDFRVITSAGAVRWIHQFGRAHVNTAGESGRRRAGVIQDITEQHQAQAQMRLLETCIAHLNDMVIITEAEPVKGSGGHTVFVNHAFERITGYRRDEVLGKSLRFLDGPNTDLAELRRIGAARKNQQSVRAELINYTRSGEELWVELDSVPVFDATGALTHWVTVGRDMTGRKHDEKALSDSEQRYAALFEAAPVPMYVFANDTLQFLAVNSAAIQGYGYSAEEFLSMTLFDFYPEVEHDHLRQTLAEDVPRRTGSWQHRRKDASVFPVEAVSQSIHYAGRAARFVVALDITAQLKAENDMAEHLFMLQRAADAAQAVVWHQTVQGTLQ